MLYAIYTTVFVFVAQVEGGHTLEIMGVLGNTNPKGSNLTVAVEALVKINGTAELANKGKVAESYLTTCTLAFHANKAHHQRAGLLSRGPVPRLNQSHTRAGLVPVHVEMCVPPAALRTILS